MRNLKYPFLMALAAFFWGSTFVAQRLGAGILDAYTFNSVRSFLGSAALALVAATLGRKGAALQLATPAARRELLVGGFLCGLALTIPAILQQIGVGETSAGKAGFITSLYILMVPVFGIFLGRKCGLRIWAGVALALAGMYLLCIKEGFAIGRGDMMVLGCAFTFTFHIYLIDHYSKRVDGICLSLAQFLFCGVFSLVPFLWNGLGAPAAGDVLACWKPLLYSAVFSTGIAYTLQIVAQKHLEPTVASLLMSLESVFAVLSGWVALGERLTAREALGCILVFAAVIIAQIRGAELGGGARDEAA